MIPIEDRAQIFWDELTSFKHQDPVAWIAAALRQFQKEIELERPNLTMKET